MFQQSPVMASISAFSSVDTKKNASSMWNKSKSWPLILHLLCRVTNMTMFASFLKIIATQWQEQKLYTLHLGLAGGLHLFYSFGHLQFLEVCSVPHFKLLHVALHTLQGVGKSVVGSEQSMERADVEHVRSKLGLLQLFLNLVDVADHGSDYTKKGPGWRTVPGFLGSKGSAVCIIQ